MAEICQCLFTQYGPMILKDSSATSNGVWVASADNNMAAATLLSLPIFRSRWISVARSCHEDKGKYGEFAEFWPTLVLFAVIFLIGEKRRIKFTAKYGGYNYVLQQLTESAHP